MLYPFYTVEAYIFIHETIFCELTSVAYYTFSVVPSTINDKVKNELLVANALAYD